MDGPPDDVRREPDLDLQRDEAVLGAYKNRPDRVTWLFFTTQGVRYQTGGKWPLVPYREIAAAPLVSKDRRSVLVQLQDGRAIELPVEGGEGRLRDALEVMRFLNRVADDLRPSSAGGPRQGQLKG